MRLSIKNDDPGYRDDATCQDNLSIWLDGKDITHLGVVTADEEDGFVEVYLSEEQTVYGCGGDLTEVWHGKVEIKGYESKGFD